MLYMCIRIIQELFSYCLLNDAVSFLKYFAANIHL